MSVRSATPLPPFRYDWTGNDIKAIHALADTVYGYVSPSLAVVSKLDDSVNALVQAAGWQGQAAQTFKNVWERDSAEAVALTGLMNSGGEVFDSLALKLAWIQVEWENLDPDPQKAHATGRAAAQAQIARAVNTAAQDLYSLSADKIASVARQAINDGTISAAQRETLDSTLRVSLGGLPQRPSSRKPEPATDTQFFGSHTVKDAGAGAGFGTLVGGLVGGGIGLLGGPFAEVTVAIGYGTGTGIGLVVGGTLGGIWGLGEDLHIW